MKKSLILFLSFALYSITMQAQLSQHQWKDRIILIFSESPEDRLMIQQLAQLEEDSEGLKDRDLVIYKIYKESGIDPAGKLLNPAMVEQLRSVYEVSGDSFSVVLIGKDGGKKLRKTNILLSQEILYQTIDAMPMRRAEMGRKN
ncbi:MAG: DUF4174 domain-containing protein [Bacteroidota bacterium]